MTTQKYNCLLLYAYYVIQHMATPKGKIAKLQQFSHAYLDGALRGTDAFFIIIGFRRWHFGTPRQLYVRSRFSFFFFVVLSLSFGFGLLVVILSPGRRHNFVKWAPERVFDRGVREGLGADTSWLCKECTRDHRQARHTRCSYT
jgi:hypothetical protein